MDVDFSDLIPGRTPAPQQQPTNDLNFDDLIPKKVPEQAGRVASLPVNQPGQSLNFDDLIPDAQPEQPSIIDRVTDSAGRIFDAGVRGAKTAAVPDDPLGFDPDTIADLRKSGFFRNETPSIMDPIRLFNEAVIGGGAFVGDLALRALNVPVRAATAAVGQTAQELGSSQGMGRRLERDLNSLVDVSAIAAGNLPGRVAPRSIKGARPVNRVDDVQEIAPDSVPPQPTAEQVNTLPAVVTGPNKSQGPRIDPARASQQTQDAVKGDFAGNINLDNINATEDVKHALRRVAEGHKDFTDARRGKVTFEETTETATALGMTTKKLKQRIKGRAFNAEEMLAARTLLVDSGKRLMELAARARSGADVDRLAFAKALTRHIGIQEQVSGATAEAGRTLSQMRMLAGAGKDVDRIKEALAGIDGPNRRLDDIIEMMNTFDDPAKASQFASKAMKPKASDMLLEFWINGLLSGPRTHATNILSNSLVALWAIPEAAAGATVSLVTGSKAIKGPEAVGRMFGLVEGAKDGIRAAVKAFITEEPTDAAAKLEVRRFRSIPSVTLRKGAKKKRVAGVPVPFTGQVELGGKQVRLPGRSLMAADEFFKAIGFRQELNARAIRIGMREGLKGEALSKRITELVSNPSDAMTRAAKNNAERQTFTNPLGKAGRAVQSIRSDHLPLAVLMPFVRTPVNIVKFAAQRGPLAPLFKEVRENLKGANGLAARDDQIGKIMLGSSVSVAAVGLAAEGLVTGAGPTDFRKRAVLYQSGWQPYSVKIGDSYYSYSRLEPLGIMFGVAADMAELNKHMKTNEKQNVAALLMGSISKNLVSKTWLRGPADLIEAIQDPDRYGARYAQRLIGSLVPTGVAQIAQVNDPMLRKARSILDQVKSRIPGLRETLPLKRDIFGEPINLGGSLGPNLISPIFTSEISSEPVINEMKRLGFSPSMPRQFIRNVPLNDSEWEMFQKTAGGIIKPALEKIIASPAWVGLDDFTKAELMRNVFRKGRDVARSFTLARSPDLIARLRKHMTDKALKRHDIATFKLSRP